MNLLKALQKLTTSSAALREASSKEAGVMSSIGHSALKNPIGVGFGVLTATQVPDTAKSSYKKYKGGFDPKLHKQNLGMESR